MRTGTGYSSLVKRSNFRRTEIASLVWACQALCGGTLTAYAPYFLVQAGFDPSASFTLSVGMYGLAVLGGMIAWWLLSVVGRRTLYVVGIAAAVVILLASGLVAAILKADSTRNWIVGSSIIVLTFAYNLTIGPVCYVVVAEIPCTRLRTKTVATARAVYNLFTMMNNFIAPHMMNPTAWNLQGKTTFVYAGTASLCLLWTYFRLPETQKLSYLELDMLFESSAPTSKFKKLGDTLAETPYVSVADAERMRNRWHGWLAYS